MTDPMVLEARRRERMRSRSRYGRRSTILTGTASGPQGPGQLGMPYLLGMPQG